MSALVTYDFAPIPLSSTSHDLPYDVILLAAMSVHTIILLTILVRMQRMHSTLLQLQTSIRDLNNIIALLVRFDMFNRNDIGLNESDDEVYAKALCMSV